MVSVMCVHQLEHLQSRMANKLIMCMLPHHTCLKQSEINSTLHKCSVCQFGSQGPRDPWVLSPLNIASLIWVATQTAWGLPASHDPYRRESKKDHKSAVNLVLLKGQLYKLGYFWHLNRLVMLLTIIAHSLCQFIGHLTFQMRKVLVTRNPTQSHQTFLTRRHGCLGSRLLVVWVVKIVWMTLLFNR